MRQITWFRLVAVGVLFTSIAGWAQAPQAQTPQATVRELATIEGDVNGFVALPSGRALIYSIRDDSTYAYDVATKRRTLLGTNIDPSAVSPLGDRLAFFRSSEDRTGSFLWTMPIDPQTAVATGPAQRVSLRPGRNARFSPDGKMVAFTAGPRQDGTWDVSLVPATGGAERVVATYPNRVIHGWSADGKFLHVELRSGQTAIERVPASGGQSEPLFPRTLWTNEFVVGLSPDARVAFFQYNPDRFTYRTASSVEGEISVPLPPLDDGWGNDLTLDRTLRYTTLTKVLNREVRILDLASGQARDLLPGNVPSSTPAWSPDGRRLAVLSGNLSHYDITIVNADGSSPRRYPVSMHLDGNWDSPDALVWETPWSPDGRFLAFRANRATEGQKVGWSPADQDQLVLLDVASGQTRVLTTSSAGIGRFVWRSDGNAVRAIKGTVVPRGSLPRYSVVEIPLNGPERQLSDISADFPKVNGGLVFTSDSAVVATVTDQNKTERFLVPLNGGVTRRLPDPGTDPGSRIGGTLVAGDRLLLAEVDAKGEARVIKILSTAGDPTRTLRLPFSGSRGVVLPNGQQIVSVGKATGDSVDKLFLVPLDGRATRLIGDIPPRTSFLGGLLVPSPDGKLLAYTSEGSFTSKILEVDFSPAFREIMKR
jgi:Tol biopolymer transport system component